MVIWFAPLLGLYDLCLGVSGGLRLVPGRIPSGTPAAEALPSGGVRQQLRSRDGSSSGGRAVVVCRVIGEDDGSLLLAKDGRAAATYTAWTPPA